MNKIFFICLFYIFPLNYAFSQEQLNIDYEKALKDQIRKKYETHSFYVDQITKDETPLASVYLLIITNNRDLSFFLKNVNKFSNLEGVHIFKVKINNFKFLKNLKNLKIVSLAQNKSINYESLINEMNGNSNIQHLYIRNRKLKKQPKGLNDLKHLKSLGIIDTKIQYFNISLNLRYLKLSENNNINYDELKAFNTTIIDLSDNGEKPFPEVLACSDNLEAIIFGWHDSITFNCPINGFQKLRIIDIFGSGFYGLNENECFPDARELTIIQQMKFK